MKDKVSLGEEPWIAGWNVLVANPHSSVKWTPRPVEMVYRGEDGAGHEENYSNLFNDAAAAYALALRWKVSGDDAYADKAILVLDAWADQLIGIRGTSDKFLASGIYGYQLANAGEIMRTYKNWPKNKFLHFQQMLLAVFYPMNHDFLANHNGAKTDHYWANWDLANMASMMAIGILADREDTFAEAVDYFKHGKGNGAIDKLVWKIYPDGLGQTQESGRDQGHNTLNVGLLGAICQMAWNQNEDLFGYEDNRVLKGVEYIAKYNLGFDVPYTSYQNSDVVQPKISDVGRGDTRPVWELFYNHYVIFKGLKAPYLEMYAKKIRPEGGGGNYGPNSGGFDQLGYGTLTYSLP
ncbi:alginate lyase [Xylophilus ampelinus]|uniref:Alginate lyase n=2 Tax=Xylophilus ampelinus TaxID=54067 RepID=A0A318SII1_9BURK|nr:alginate lyase [Xylophilus ampelinus]